MNNFDNTSTSGFYNNELVFDGINDYVDIGYANYDFHNTQSMVMYLKLNVIKYQALFGSWNGAGGGLLLDQEYYFAMRTFCDGVGYINSIYNQLVNTDNYYTLVGVLDGSTSKVYVNGRLVATKEQNNYKNSDLKIFIGGDPQTNTSTNIDLPSNRGNLDATLDEIIKTDSSNSAVIITYSGYAEGQKLYKNSSLDIKVKISYNPEYSGGEATGTSNITFSFKEADSKVDENDKPIIEDDTIISKDDKTITYNCQENGGEESNQTSVFNIGDNVDLNVQCHKEGYSFLGWNTDKDATSVISDGSLDHTTLNNSTSNTTLYGIYQKPIDITYTKDNGVKTISKESDTCTIYNKTSSCDKILPTVVLITMKIIHIMN